MSDSATVVLRDPQHRLAWACDTASFTGIPACSTRVHRVVPTRNLGLGSVADFEVAMPQQGSWRLTVRSNRPRVPGRTSDFFVQAVVRDASGHDNDGEVFGNFLPPNSDSLRWDVVIRSSGKHYYLPGFELKPIGNKPTKLE